MVLLGEVAAEIGRCKLLFCFDVVVVDDVVFNVDVNLVLLMCLMPCGVMFFLGLSGVVPEFGDEMCFDHLMSHPKAQRMKMAMAALASWCRHGIWYLNMETDLFWFLVFLRIPTGLEETLHNASPRALHHAVYAVLFLSGWIITLFSFWFA